MKFQKDLLHTLSRSVASLPRLAPRWKFLATPVVMMMWGCIRFKKLYKLYNYVNNFCIIMILTTVIRNIYIIFIPWVKQSFPNYEDFSNQRNIPKVCMKSYDRKHQNKKAPYRGRRDTPLPHPPPAWSLRSLALASPMTILVAPLSLA